MHLTYCRQERQTGSQCLLLHLTIIAAQVAYSHHVNHKLYQRRSLLQTNTQTISKVPHLYNIMPGGLFKVSYLQADSWQTACLIYTTSPQQAFSDDCHMCKQIGAHTCRQTACLIYTTSCQEASPNSFHTCKSITAGIQLLHVFDWLSFASA